jgi:hypothetical protein
MSPPYNIQATGILTSRWKDLSNIAFGEYIDSIRQPKRRCKHIAHGVSYRGRTVVFHDTNCAVLFRVIISMIQYAVYFGRRPP